METSANLAGVSITFDILMIFGYEMFLFSVFVHNLGNKLRSRYSSKNVDTKPILNSSPATKENATRGFSNLDNHDESAPSSPLITIKRKADHDPHLMSASKRSAYIYMNCFLLIHEYCTCTIFKAISPSEMTQASETCKTFDDK